MMMSLLVITLLGINVLIGILIFKEVNPTAFEKLTSNKSNQEMAAPSEQTIEDPQQAEPSLQGQEPGLPMDDLGVEWETEPTFREDEIQGYGGVEGVLTWQYNDFVGTKGDVNAQVFLIPKAVDFSMISEEDVQSYFLIGTPIPNARTYYTKADGYGNYNLNYIPEGPYVLIAFSFETFNLDDYVSQEAQMILPDLLKEHWNWFYKNRLLSRNHIVKEIYITKDQIQTISHDFGYKM